jgi:ABC-type antimicrobial peptide transport system permease subunit
MAPLQKRALYGLIFGVVWAVTIIVVFIMRGGVNAFNEDLGFRLIVDGLWIGGLVVYLILFRTIIGKPGKFDERDKLIMDRAPNLQWMAVIIALVVWMIALSEVYHDVGQVPVVFLFLIFMSSLIVSMIAQSMGILIGYRRMERNA